MRTNPESKKPLQLQESLKMTINYNFLCVGGFTVPPKMPSWKRFN